MKITKIESQKKTRGRVNIFIDDEFSFGTSENAMVDFGLHKGKELTGAEIEKIKEADDIVKALTKAYRFLSFRVRSEKEMREKLLERFSEVTVEKAMDRLKALGYIDDQEFTRIWISGRGISRGKKALQVELIKKGIPKEIIAETLEGIDIDSELENALNLIKSKGKYKLLGKDEYYKKVAPFLMRRGYSYEIIKKVITEICGQ